MPSPVIQYGKKATKTNTTNTTTRARPVPSDSEDELALRSSKRARTRTTEETLENGEEVADCIVVSRRAPRAVKEVASASSRSKAAGPKGKGTMAKGKGRTATIEQEGSASSSSRKAPAESRVEVVVPATTRTRARPAVKNGSSSKVSTSSAIVDRSKPKARGRLASASPSPSPSASSSAAHPYRSSSRASKPTRKALEGSHPGRGPRTPNTIDSKLRDSPLPSPSPLRHIHARSEPSSEGSPSPSHSRSPSPSFSSAGKASASTSTKGVGIFSEQQRERDRFLQNERWSKAKEARNFNWEGDVSEPRKLRGGKVVVVENEKNGREEIGEEKEEMDMVESDADARKRRWEKGKQRAEDKDGMNWDSEISLGGTRPGEDGMEGGISGDLQDNAFDDLTYDTFPGSSIEPVQTSHIGTNKTADLPPEKAKPILHPSVRLFLNRILDHLASKPNLNPPPFPDEPSFASLLPTLSSTTGDSELDKDRKKEAVKKYEALGQLVGLLMGTVSRGEGNSCLVLGGKGSGKTRTVNRALTLVSDHLAKSGANKKPIVVRLDGVLHTNDMLAIREMGRQIAEGEGRAAAEDEGEDEDGAGAEDYAPTTLPAHLLALLTQSSERSIVIVMENFDLFTQHARQALLYCLLDVVQSIRTGPVETTGRGVAVIGVTSRVDTTLLLEKRVKSRFSQRVFRVASPLAGSDMETCKETVKRALVTPRPIKESEEWAVWFQDWQAWVDSILGEASVQQNMQRLLDVTTDVRLMYRPFLRPILAALDGDQWNPMKVAQEFRNQSQESGWQAKFDKLKGLSAPALVVLIIAKHFSYAGKEEFNFAMAQHEYHRFAQSSLAGSGRSKWSDSVLQTGWNQLYRTGLLFPATRFRPNPNPYMQKFLLCRSLLSRNEIVAYFKADGAKLLGTELGNWGRTAGGHA